MPRVSLAAGRRCAAALRLAAALAAAAVPALGAGACSRPEPAPYVVSIDLADDIRGLASQDADGGDERAEAAERLLKALGAASRPPLLAALDREDGPVRAAAAELLADLPGAAGDEPTVARLERLASSDPDAAVRAAGVTTLGGMAGERARPVVEAALRDGDAGVRLAAAGACRGLCSSPEALAALAAMAIAEPSLGHGLAARRVLLRLRDEGGQPERVTEVSLRAAAAALAQENGQATERAVRAALLLADQGDPRGIAALAGAARDPRAPALRVHAVFALGQVGGAGEVAALSPLLREPGVALYAHDALRRLSSRGVEGAATALQGYDGPRSEAPILSPYAY